MLSDADCGDSPNIYRRDHVTRMGFGVGMRSGHVVIGYLGSIIVLRLVRQSRNCHHVDDHKDFADNQR